MKLPKKSIKLIKLKIKKIKVNKTKISFSFFILLLLNYLTPISKANFNTTNIRTKSDINKKLNSENNKIKLLAEIEWREMPSTKTDLITPIWKKVDEDRKFTSTKNSTTEKTLINSMNRSIVFNNDKVGPDISWLVPPGLAWNNKYLFDTSVRGHSRRDKGESFWGWNGGDAVGQFYYHIFKKGKYGLGLNLGMRSVYQGNMSGGTTSIGEGLSSGFRFDYELSKTAGIALGAEQLIHFDGLTDTGRDLYISASKGFWKNGKEGIFPLNIYTAGFGTGKMAEGNIKGLCSDLFGGSGTEIAHQRRLCWAPIFSVARVYNENISTFFEYNSKWFLLGTSYAPFEKIPARATFAIQLSDHIDNYKINNFQELKYVFRLSLGF